MQRSLVRGDSDAATATWKDSKYKGKIASEEQGADVNCSRNRAWHLRTPGYREEAQVVNNAESTCQHRFVAFSCGCTPSGGYGASGRRAACPNGALARSASLTLRLASMLLSQIALLWDKSTWRLLCQCSQTRARILGIECSCRQDNLCARKQGNRQHIAGFCGLRVGYCNPCAIQSTLHGGCCCG